jgi:hypothetical protein
MLDLKFRMRSWAGRIPVLTQKPGQVRLTTRFLPRDQRSAHASRFLFLWIRFSLSEFGSSKPVPAQNSAPHPNIGMLYVVCS